MIENVTTEPSVVRENQNFKIKVKVTDYNTETEKGESLTLENTKANGKMKFVLNGQSSQEVIPAVAGTTVTGTDISINDYDDTKESKFTEFAGDTFQQTYQGYNLLSGDTSYSNSNTDTRTNVVLQLWLGTSTNAQASLIASTNIYGATVYSYTFTPEQDYTRFRIKHSGGTTDLSKTFNIDLQANITYRVRINITGANPSVQNGFSYNDVMITQGTEAKDYEPYVRRNSKS